MRTSNNQKYVIECSSDAHAKNILNDLRIKITK